ncbi:MAG: aldo/keto reductase [Bacteroidales bacterium]|nr:aldo/keto reductase [Bacteroidales bacterium]
MILEETYTLSNGVRIPKVGLGTWLIPDDQAAGAVKAALALGYHHIDTAQAYENERGVGEGLRESGLKRDQYFLTTKVAAENKTYESAAASIDESLRKLGLEYADLIIIHCPQPWAEFRGAKRYFKENKQVWKALEDAYEAGKVRAIGVSNFLVDDLQNILEDCRIKPMVNQILLHAGETPRDLLDFCANEGILVEAYSPIAHGQALNNGQLAEVAARYGVTIPQLCIKYTLQLGAVTLPKSSNPDHIKSNVQLDFTISDEDMAFLAGIGQDYGDDSWWPVFSGKKQV